MLNFISFLIESHPQNRAERRRESAKIYNDIRQKITRIEKTMGSLSKEGQNELIKITNNFSKWPGEGPVRRLFRMGNKTEKPSISDRRRGSEDSLTEAKKSDEEIKKKAQKEMDEIRERRAKLTHCQLCGHELDFQGGALKSGLCHICAADHFN